MKENKYDEIEFFNKYSEMSRSRYGLAKAGEWECLKKLLPDFNGKTVLDLGCGYGWHCLYAAENGAKEVIGVDISEKMLEVAREKTGYPQVKYQRIAIEDINFPNDHFDVVLSSLALHYVDDLQPVFRKIRNCLKPQGVFVFSIEHPVFTAEGKQEWIMDEEGNKLYWPLDNYFSEGEREAVFLGEKITKYHHTLTTIIETLLDLAYEIEAVVEPKPTQEMIKETEGMLDEMRRPMMLIVKASKK